MQVVQNWHVKTSHIMQREESDIFKLAEIITRSFEQELSVHERQKLENWLAESDSHREQYEQFKTIEFLRQKSQARVKIDWQKDCQNFLERKNKRHSFIRPLFRYVAVAVLLLSISTVLWLYERPATSDFMADRISPIRKKAVLTLAQGEQITLSDSTYTQLQDLSGAHIDIQGSQVTYLHQGGDTTCTLYNTLHTPRGGEYMLTLVDGTKVWLNAESVIRYPVKFNSNKRIVYIEGEAFFEVQKDTAHPFVVVSDKTEVTVLGTSFNFRAYPEENTISTTLVEGTVRIENTNAKQEMLLNPGEQGVLDTEKGTLSKQKVDTYLYTAWKDGRIVFRDIRLEDLFNTLARWYDLQVFYLNPEVKDIRFTGDIDKTDRFENILSIMEQNERVKFSVNARTISIRLQTKQQ